MIASLSLDFNLRMLNLWVSLCEDHEPSLPKHFFRLGYKVRWVEPSFTVQIPVEEEAKNKGAGAIKANGSVKTNEPAKASESAKTNGPVKPNEPGTEDNAKAALTFKAVTVNPELLISSSPQRHALLFEFKKGKNVEEQQLVRYMLIRSSDISTFLADSTLSSHDILYVAPREYQDDFLKGIKANNSSFPVMFVCDHGVTIGYSKFTNAALNDALGTDEIIPIDWEMVPTYFSFYQHSDQITIGRALAPELVQLIISNGSDDIDHFDVSLEDLMRRLCRWTLVHQKSKTPIRRVVIKLLQRLTKFPPLAGEFALLQKNNEKHLRIGVKRSRLGTFTTKFEKFLKSLQNQPLQLDLDDF